MDFGVNFNNNSGSLITDLIREGITEEVKRSVGGSKSTGASTPTGASGASGSTSSFGTPFQFSGKPPEKLDLPSKTAARNLDLNDLGGFEGFAALIYAIRATSVENQMLSITTGDEKGGGALADPLDGIESVSRNAEFTAE